MMDKRFDYTAYQERDFATVEEMDKLLLIVLDPDKSYGKSIIAGIKIGAALAVMCARSRAMKNHMEMVKQKYIVKWTERDQDDLNRDPLDSERRPA